ncbi:hypothetical protein [Salmonella enterica]|uniref:hypothetical protein n=1 Tax=Salmonella enterica TaxID=28901 RepID=UPI00344D2501
MDNAGPGDDAVGATGEGDAVDTTDVVAVVLPVRSFPLKGLRPVAATAGDGVA